MSFPRKKNTLLFLLFFLSISLFSQEIKKGEVYNYARKIVDTITSESMHGRGYVNDGDKIAANYIKTEFQKFGLKSFTKNYYQKFSFPVNTFPGKMSLNIDGKELIPGKDYIIKANSKSIDTTCSLTDFKRKGLIDFQNKLTMETSQVVSPSFTIQALSSNIDTSGTNISVSIENKFIPNYKSQNIIGYVQGSEYSDSFIVFSAHYDHLGQMGDKVYFPGANDNASGCAMLLNLAKYYSMSEHKPKYSIAFMAFCGEEVGLLGSKYYTEHPLFPLKNIRFLLNMDIMGTGEEGITVVNGSVFKEEFDKLKQINTENNFIKDVKIRGKAANSDHYFFSENGVKAFFIYTMGGIKAYHDIYDKAETLPLNEFEDLFKMITKFNDYLQN